MRYGVCMCSGCNIVKVNKRKLLAFMFERKCLHSEMTYPLKIHYINALKIFKMILVRIDALIRQKDWPVCVNFEYTYIMSICLYMWAMHCMSFVKILDFFSFHSLFVIILFLILSLSLSLFTFRYRFTLILIQL